MSEVFKPKLRVKIGGKSLPIAFDLNTSPTKKGIVIYFILEEQVEDPRDVQELTNKISTWLQKKFADQKLMVTYNDRNSYSQNTISFIVPLSSMVDLLTRNLKGEGAA
jgi:hypothetical protein